MGALCAVAFASTGASVALALASGHFSTGRVVAAANMQSGSWRVGAVTTRKTVFGPMGGMQGRICALGEVAATISVDGSGAPMQLRVHVDDGPLLVPSAVTFTPIGRGSIGSYTFLTSVATLEGYDGHVFALEWRSFTGQSATVSSATMQLVYAKGSHHC